MKKLILCLSAVIMMFSCSKNEVGDPTGKGQMILNVTAENVFVTRANEISSYEPIQTVDDVMLYTYKNDGNGNYVKLEDPTHIDQWRRGETWVNYTMSLEPGKYRFVVVGQYKRDCYNVEASDRFGDMAAKINTGLNDAQEIFSGLSDEIEITENGGRAAVQMKRQVGGLLAYFKNVPQKIEGKTIAFLRVKTSRVTHVFNPFNGRQIESSGEANVIDMDLRRQEVTLDGIYKGNDLSSNGVVKMNLTQLGGTYLLPSGGTDMVVQLCDADNNPIKEWRVIDDRGSKEFEIVPNHLYALGTKKMKGNISGDAPIDLMEQQVLSITIDANWESIYDMNILD